MKCAVVKLPGGCLERMLAKITKLEYFLELVHWLWVRFLFGEEREAFWKFATCSWVHQSKLIAVSIALMGLEEFENSLVSEVALVKP